MADLSLTGEAMEGGIGDWSESADREDYVEDVYSESKQKGLGGSTTDGFVIIGVGEERLECRIEEDGDGWRDEEEEAEGVEIAALGVEDFPSFRPEFA